MKHSFLYVVTWLFLAMFVIPFKVWGGEIKLSFSGTGDLPQEWSVIDSEGYDGKWIVENSKACSPAATAVDGSILVTPGIDMLAGVTYMIYSDVYTSSSSSPIHVQLLIGKDPNNLLLWKEVDVSATWGAYFPQSASERKFVPNESGVYYIGIRSTAGTYEGTTLSVAFISYEAIIDTPQRADEVLAAPLFGKECKVTLTWYWPTQTKEGKELIQGEIKGAKIFRKQDNAPDISVADNLLTTVKLDAIPGAEGSYIDTDFALEKGNGEYHYKVVPFTELGSAEIAMDAECWVGEDIRVLNPIDIIATLKGSKVVELTFTKRNEGANGGWVDLNEIGYKIVRKTKESDYSYINEVILEENYKGELPYIDNTITEQGNYRYYISTVYKGEAGTEVNSDLVRIMDPYDLPYSDDFSSGSLENYILENEGSSSYDNWKYDTSNGYVYTSGSSYSSFTKDFITPPFELQAGHTYRISLTSWVDCELIEDYWGIYDGDPVPKDVDFIVGSSAKQSAMTSIRTVTVDKSVDEKMLLEAFYVPKESGIYHFGFRCKPTTSDKIYVDDLSISETIITPADITDFKVTPATDGTCIAELSFTVPSITNGGEILNEITSVILTRKTSDSAEEVVNTFLDITPGQAVTYTDEVPTEGLYTWGVSAYINETASNTVYSTEYWIGYDIPKSVSEFSISINKNEDGNPEITWDEVTAGIHGGFFDKQNVTYQVTRIPGDDVVALTTDNIAIDSIWSTLPYDVYQYSITVVNGTKESTPSIGYTHVVLGDAVELPFEPIITEDEFKRWDSHGWIIDFDNTLTCKNYAETTVSEDLYAYMPPFRIKEANSNYTYTFAFDVSRVSAEYEEFLNIYICQIHENPEKGALDKNKIILGEDNKTLLQSIVVTSLYESPQSEEISFSINESGRYRIAIECASVFNSGVKIHKVSLKESVVTRLDNTDLIGKVVYDVETSTIKFPDEVVSYSLVNMQGIVLINNYNKESVNISYLPMGIYNLIVYDSFGNVKTIRIVKK